MSAAGDGRARAARGAAFAGASAVLLAPALPLGGRVPGVDSGVFLYIGWRILGGALPYRDAWDSKPPLIHHLNALGLWLGGGSEWGVWALQAALLAAALAAGGRALEREFGGLPALLGGGAAAACVAPCLEGGNFAEVYALAPQCLALALIGGALSGRTRAAALGALAGALFSLKQNLIAIPAAWLLTRLAAGAASEAGLFAASFAAAAAAPAAYFALRGAAGEYWRAVFVYNLINGTPGLDARLASLAEGAKVCAGGIWAAAAGWALALRGFARGEPRARAPLVAVCLLALPLELLASSVTGRAFKHYYLAWLPSAAVLAAYGFRAALERPRAAGAAVLAAALMAFVSLGSWREDLSALLARPQDPVVALLRRSTAPSDAALIWGDAARYNFASRRESPSRFAIQHPLLRRGFQSAALSAEFQRDLERRPPAVIVDTAYADADFPPLDAAGRARWRERPYYTVEPGLEKTFAWISARYAPAARLEGLVVYAPRHD